jgi:short-subunit dehydrogenase
MNWRDQIGIVTGASSGIGRAIALALAAQGMALGLIGRDAGRLEEVASEARSFGSRVLKYGADLSQDDEIGRLRCNLQDDFGAIDVLVHSAGSFFIGPIESAPMSEFDQLFRINMRAPYALTQTLMSMIRARRGQIVFINSSVGLRTRANIGAYAATKYGLKAIADTLRDELNPDGVRVLSIFPGRTATPQQEAIHAIEGHQYHPELLMQPTDVATAVLDALAMSRSAEMTDICIRPLQKT